MLSDFPGSRPISFSPTFVRLAGKISIQRPKRRHHFIEQLDDGPGLTVDGEPFELRDFLDEQCQVGNPTRIARA